MTSTRGVLPLRVVTTPTLDRLVDYAESCRRRVLIASPFVNGGIGPVVDALPMRVARTLITRTDLRSFALGVSDLETLCDLARQGFRVRALAALHAKVYVFDAKAALVTSANATYAGLARNRECGLETTDTNVVAQLASILLSGFGAETRPRRLTTEDLENLRSPVLSLKASMPEAIARAAPDEADAVEPAFSVADETEFTEGFHGWTRLVLQGVLAMAPGSFSLDDLLTVCRPVAKREYPRNYHVREKLRQQLQILRDLGIAEFLGEGIYRHTLERPEKGEQGEP